MEKEEVVTEEFLETRPGSQAQREARQQFLKAIREKAPGVLRSLADDVLPAYKAVYAPNRKSGEAPDPSLFLLAGFAIKDIASAYNRVSLASEDFYGKREKEVRQFQQALRRWAERWHLIDYWLLDAVQRTLQEWSQRKILGELDWNYEGDFADGYPIDRVVSFKFMTWDAKTEPWKEYEKRFLQAAKAWIREYRDETRPQGRGRKRLARNKREQMHFAWLVENQVNELPITSKRGRSIVSEYSGRNLLDHTTVSEAIDSLASFIGLTKRPLKPGRPPRSRPV